MNNFVLQGRLLYREPPKAEGRSALAVIAIGKNKPESGALVQSVNKVIIRFPRKLTHLLEKFGEGDYIEVAGNITGRAHYSIGTGSSIATINLVAGTAQKCIVSHLVKQANVSRLLSCTWQATGLIKAIREPRKEGRPHTLYLQSERPIIRHKGVASQPTAVFPITVYDNSRKFIEKLEPQMAVDVSGHIHGLLRKMPVPGVDGEFEQSLEVGLVLRHAQQCSIVPAKLYESRDERKERELAAKRAVKEAEDATNATNDTTVVPDADEDEDDAGSRAAASTADS